MPPRTNLSLTDKHMEQRILYRPEPFLRGKRAFSLHKYVRRGRERRPFCYGKYKRLELMGYEGTSSSGEKI